MSKEKAFGAIIPAQLEKDKDGNWRIYGLASSDSLDQQNEKMNIDGLDLSHIENGQGLINYDHKKGPENTLGVLDTYNKSKNKLYLGGYLFKHHERAKYIQQIMTSLDKKHDKRVGLSIEGVIVKRADKDKNIIDKAKITNCAITFQPANADTYVNLVKSLEGVEDLVFEEKSESISESTPKKEKVSFDSDQVLEIIKMNKITQALAKDPTPIDEPSSVKEKLIKKEGNIKKQKGCSHTKDKTYCKACKEKITKSVEEKIKEIQAQYPGISRQEIQDKYLKSLKKSLVDDLVHYGPDTENWISDNVLLTNFVHRMFSWGRYSGELSLDDGAKVEKIARKLAASKKDTYEVLKDIYACITGMERKDPDGKKIESVIKA